VSFETGWSSHPTQVRLHAVVEKPANS
jgi:hypothetical protein